MTVKRYVTAGGRGCGTGGGGPRLPGVHPDVEEQL